tara:strand:- start:618 stop:1397 length:780 start_codon:yes stop_codon:yes gene_type:complete
MKINKPTPFRYKKNPGKSPIKYSFNAEMAEFDKLGEGLKEEIKVAGPRQISAPDAKGQDFKNNFADAQNAFANMNMENFAEDLTVNQGQAQFEKEMGMQQESNMLDAMRGGGGFNAGNIQAMANAGSNRRRQASASIGQQESANQQMRVSGAQDVQRRREMQAQGQSAADQLKMQGAESAQAAKAASGMAQAQMGLSAAQSNQQAATANQALQYQAASDARNLQFQHQQGMLQLISGKDAADAANKEADKNWGQKTFGW